MAIYTFGCKNPECDYRHEKILPISKYEAYLKEIEEEKIVCQECGSGLERLLLDYSSVAFNIVDNEKNGRTPSGKMIRD